MKATRHPPNAPATIAVFAPNLVGDTVMATPAFRALRRTFAQSHITLFIRSHISPVLDAAPWFDERILYNPRSADRGEHTLAALGRLRRARPALALLFQTLFAQRFSPGWPASRAALGSTAATAAFCSPTA